MRVLFLLLLFLASVDIACAQQAPATNDKPNNAVVASDGVLEVPSGALHRLESSPKISYPFGATMYGIQGQVVLELTIAPDGKVEKVKVISGDPELADPTTRTVKKWQFAPYSVNDVPTRARTQYTFNFAFTDNVSNFKDESGQPAAQVGQGVSQGMLLHQVKPEYPPDARHNHISGTVKLRALIGKDGHIQNLRVLSGSRILAEAAYAAVVQWTYRPYKINGSPVEIDTVITVNYELR